MPLARGTVLASYEIIAPLGAGGMGEVYRARDRKLGREVAIKILPEEFVREPERVARFEREAQLLAALNHPNIAAIYGVENSGATPFLVLELVDGESLAERLRSVGAGQGLALGETLAIARQVVDALEAAHDKGIVHRDLKPANVMITHDGQVKVLDFGLAKLEVDPASATGGLTHSPTLTFAATQAGVILGTAAYMSPEQVKGRPADKRSDVWAFGCVLFEMLTGRRAFEGEDVSDTLAAILRGEPAWSAFPADVPPHVRALVRRCLQKDRKSRIPDLSVVRFLLDEPIESQPSAASVAREPSRRSALMWKTAAPLLASTTVIGLYAWYQTQSVSPASMRFLILPPENGTYVTGGTAAAAHAAVSPDGLKLAFTLRDVAGKVLLWVRPIDSLAAQPLTGTDNAAYPFWSPDSRFIGYSTPGRLMKVAVAGGPPQTLCAFSGPNIVGRGGAWNRDGVILFNNGPGPLYRVSSAGGQPSPVGHLMTGQNSQNFPTFLPDARRMLFFASSAGEATGLYVGSLDTGESKRLVESESGAVYAPRNRVLLFVRDGTLLAQSFDPKTLDLSGEPFPVVEHVASGAVPGVVAFSLSDNGVLAYGIGPPLGTFEIVSVDRHGKSIQTVGSSGRHRRIELSSDGQRVAVDRGVIRQGGDIWLTELTRSSTSRFTFDPSQNNQSPIWSPDDTTIAFTSLRSGKWGIYARPSRGAGNEQRLLESDNPVYPMSWSPDGGSIVYQTDTRSASPGSIDVWLLPLSADRRPAPLAATAFSSERSGQISPDGRWLAYASNETGTSEIYVQAFPAATTKWPVSTGGGWYPRWRRDGRELFYLRPPNGKMMAVDVRTNGSTFDIGETRELFESGYFFFPAFNSQYPYSVTADGQRFFIPRPVADPSAPAQGSIAVIVNWAAGIKN
jgi:eukaryotic-like serine/threonine-protein kinase